MTEPDHGWLQWLKIKLGLRDNEYDTGTPGPPRPMTGLLSKLEHREFMGCEFTVDPSLPDDTMIVQTGAETAVFKNGAKLLSKKTS